MIYAPISNTRMVRVSGRSFCGWKRIFVREDKRRFTINRNLEKKLLPLLSSLSCVALVLVFWVFLPTHSWGWTEGGGYQTRDKCVRKQGGQENFEWLCVDGKVIYLAQSDNIKNCFTCFLKKFSDWTWEQEIRKGMREDPKYVTCRRYKRKKAKNGQQVCLYRGANDTYTLVVEGECPVEFECKYQPNSPEPNIDSVVDSLNESFKK